MVRVILLLMLTLLLASCQQPQVSGEITPKRDLEPVSWSKLPPGLQEDYGLPEWATALDESARYYAKRKPTEEIKFGSVTVTAAAMARDCQELAQLARSTSGAEFFKQLTTRFRLFRSAGHDGFGAILVTAYYEPLLHGSRTPSARYRYPLYRKPDDMLTVDLGLWLPEQAGKSIVARMEQGKLLPYFNRKQIDIDQALAKRGLELVWVDDKVDSFMLHIQGSGRIKLEEGGFLRVGYDGANGQPYRSVGKLLIDEGEVPRDKMSLPAIRAWTAEHPDQVDRVLNANPSYVFFREIDGGPYGNINVPLTPMRSIATDYRLFPRGAPAILATELPEFSADGTAISWRRHARFVVNQDTGGAIRGPGRVDLFTGFGEDAERVAGIMKQDNGALFFIGPRE